MLVDGCKSCHDSLLRHASHASRAIVTPRPLREARGRQLRQTVPGSREGTVKLSSLAAFSPPAATAKSLILSL